MATLQGFLSDAQQAFATGAGTVNDISTAVVNAANQFRQVYDPTTGTWGGVSGSVPPPTVGNPVGSVRDPGAPQGILAWVMEHPGLTAGGVVGLILAVLGIRRWLTKKKA